MMLLMISMSTMQSGSKDQAVETSDSDSDDDGDELYYSDERQNNLCTMPSAAAPTTMTQGGRFAQMPR
jgi:hypothetical protein